MGDEKLARLATRYLLDNGLLLNRAEFPVEGLLEAILRFSLMSRMILRSRSWSEQPRFDNWHFVKIKFDLWEQCFQRFFCAKSLEFPKFPIFA